MPRNAAAGAGARSCPTLTQLGARGAVRPIRVGRPECLLGSHSRVHLPLRSPLVSRVHALIVCDAREAYVRDLASRHGVFISGARIREGTLRHGDILCVGPFAFRWSMARRAQKLNPLAPAPPPPELVLSTANGAPARRFASRTILIGSRGECDMVLGGAMIDPVHAVIYRKDSKYFLRDLNSHSGTFVHTRRVRDAELREGDEIRIGLTFLRVSLRGDAADTPGGRTDARWLAGLMGTWNADHPRGHAPTIAELLGEPTEPPAVCVAQ